MNKFAIVLAVIMASLMAMPSYAAKAAPACKGLAHKACGASSQCGWVESFKRKDGVKVKAHCRTKPKAKVAKLKAKNKAKLAEQKQKNKDKLAAQKAKNKAKLAKLKEKQKQKLDDKKS